MHSHCGRYVIAYNGELFNWKEIRSTVEARRGPVAWRGHSDTEILLEAIATFGVEPVLAQFNGMFAFALWDRHERVLCLARDRLGKKPLYFALLGEHLVFASEIKAFSVHPDWSFSAERGVLQSFLRHGYIPGPRTGIVGVSKVEAGTVQWVRPKDLQSRRLSPSRRYWDAAGLRVLADEQPGSRRDLEGVLTRAVSDRMVADVPVGAFLSGGVDSSLVVALMTRVGGAGVRTYAIGFGDGAVSEAPQAAAVAKFLGTKHTELVLSAGEVATLVPSVVATFDEPLADSSAVPTWLVSRLAAQDVKVVLSGDGADELFGGYTRYAQNAKLWRLRRLFPRELSKAIRALASGTIDAPGAGTLSTVLSALTAPDATEFYRCRVSHVRDPARLIPSGVEELIAPNPIEPLRGSIEREMMYVDLVTYLPDDILAKVDRASMAHGLEVRSPFLDDRMVQFAWSLPDAELTGARGNKSLLRELLYQLIPRALVDRPKAGFGLPVEHWLAGPLRPWAEAQTVENPRLTDLGVDPGQLSMIWKHFINGRPRLAGIVWNLVVLGAWMESHSSVCGPQRT